MDAKSLITEPAFPDRLDGHGWREIRGLAWSGRGKITRVEVSIDGGKTWQNASLDEPVLPKCHTRFRLPWEWNGGKPCSMSRATDETGYVQPTDGRVGEGARAEHAVSLQQHPRVEGRRRRDREAAGRSGVSVSGVREVRGSRGSRGSPA